MTPVRWVSNTVSIVYDPVTARVITVERLIDDKGRRWAAYDGAPPDLLDDVPEPANSKQQP